MESERQPRVLAASKPSETCESRHWQSPVDIARSAVDGLPSPGLAHAIIAAVCSPSTSSSVWKLLKQAIAFRIVSPLHVLALVTVRVVPYRKARPEGVQVVSRALESALHSLHRPCLRGLAEISIFDSAFP
ncbi:putative mediator of RNA polymerase II transcription subunit 33A/B [Dioscorea sansibarensis]